MKYKIHGTAANGIEDSLVLEADTIEEIIKKAHMEAEKRKWDNCWSEEIYE